MDVEGLVHNSNKCVFSEPKIILMTVNGTFTKEINLEMLCVTIFPNQCLREGITKFVGFNKMFFYNPQKSFHSEENKYFYNQCSFEFSDKSTLKLYANGIFIVTGTLTEIEFMKRVKSVLRILNVRRYMYTNPALTDGKSKLTLVYDTSNCDVHTYKIVLANYAIELIGFEFNKYKVCNIDEIVKCNHQDNDLNIESITDIFKYSSVSIKFQNIDGNIDFYKNKTIISVQGGNEDFNKLYSFFVKYRYKLISTPMSKNINRFSFLVLSTVVNKKENEQYNNVRSKRAQNIIKESIAYLN